MALRVYNMPTVFIWGRLCLQTTDLKSYGRRVKGRVHGAMKWHRICWRRTCASPVQNHLPPHMGIACAPPGCSSCVSLVCRSCLAS